MTREVNKWTPYSLSAALLALFLAAGWMAARNDLQKSRELSEQQLFKAATSISATINTRLTESTILGTAIATAIDLNLVLTNENYSFFAKQLRGERDDIINIAVAPDLVVRFVYPEAANASVLGLDYRKRPDFLPGVMQAIETKAPILIGPVDLVQGGSGLILRVPVFNTPEAEAAPPPWGVVSVVLDTNGFFAKITADAAVAHATFALRHLPSPAAAAALPVFGDAGIFDYDPVLLTLDVMQTKWQLAMLPTGGWPAAGQNRNLIWLITFIAAANAIAVALLLLRLSARSALARRQLADAIEAIDDGFALYDKDDRLVMCNTKYRELYAASADKMIAGQTFMEILKAGLERGQFPEAVGKEDEWLAKRMELHGSGVKAVEQKLSDGTWLKISESRTRDGGTVGFRVDITDLKNARENAENAQRATSEFLNNINHEMRTPLTVILGFNAFQVAPERLRSHSKLTDVLNDPNADKAAIASALDAVLTDLKTYGKKVQNSAQHLLDLVNDTLDLAKLQHRMLSLRLEPLDLTTLSNDCLSQFSNIAQQKGLSLSHQSEPLTIMADRVRLKQILINLIGNAIKFTETGSVGIDCKQVGDKVHIDIVDTGPGIPAHDLKNVFEKFVQVENASTAVKGGTGLGLAICKQLTELHGGSIEIESEFGKGSIFRVVLPAKPPETPAA